MNKQAIFYLTLTSFSYGIFVVLTKYLLNFGLNSLSLAVSMGAFMLFFSILYLFSDLSKIRKISKINWFKILLLGFLATFVGRILMFVGQSFTTATNAGFLLKLTGLTVLPFAYFMLGEKIKKKDFIAFLIMIIGIFLLTTGGILTTSNTGDILIILLVILLGFTNSLAKQIMKDVNPNVVSSLRLIVGNGFLIGFITPFFGQAVFAPLFLQPIWIFIGSILGIITIFGLYKGIELVGASKAIIFFLLSSVFTAMFAFIFLGEVLSYIQWVGGILILTGTYLLARK